MYELLLTGVRPEPLSNYLKAVALLRIIGEQVDAAATAAWRGEVFVIRSLLDREGLEEFLLKSWSPAPVVSPWNGGSGFAPGDQQRGIEAIESSDDPRFADWRRSIATSRDVLNEYPAAEKALVLEQLRARLPDVAIRWLDAAIVLTKERPQYPPLLGTGGNDGRFEFSNNQMQRLRELLIAPTDAHTPRAQLRAALFGNPAPLDRSAKIGQFAPARAGGANTGMGFDRDALINPWDFVFSLEGALTFAAATTRALDIAPQAAFPFFVRSSGGGHSSGSVADEETSRGELWLPLWSGFATAPEIGVLAAEGRVWVGSRPAGSSSDFARAIRQLGMARGVNSFQRYALAQRNGLAFFATPAGRYQVTEHAKPDPLAPLDGWLDRVRFISEKKGCPTSLQAAHRRLGEVLLSSNVTDSDDEQLLLAVSAISRAVVRSRHHELLEFLAPCPYFPVGSWPRLSTAADPAWRLAFSAARMGIRTEIEPVALGSRARWSDERASPEKRVASSICQRLLDVGRRRLHAPEGRYSLGAPMADGARLDDLHAFVVNQVGDDRLSATVAAASLTKERLDGGSDDVRTRPLPVGLTLCLAALHGPPRDGACWPTPTRMLEALFTGQGELATQQALQHLRAHDIPVQIRSTPAMTADLARRIGAALVFPPSLSALRTTWRTIASPHLDHARTS